MIPLVIRNKYSRQPTEFICECGNKTISPYRCGIAAKNCGQCWKKDLKIGAKIRMLTLLEDVGDKRKSDKVQWQCDCGSVKNIAIKSVLSGLTSSCGCKQIRQNIGNCDKRPKTINILDLYGTQYGDLTIIDKSNIMIMDRSDTKVLTLCKCGKEHMISLGQLERYKTTNCGKCNTIDILEGTKLGKLTVAKSYYGMHRHSDTKIDCVCKCGRDHRVSMHNLNKVKSCGKCSQVMIEWWKSKQSIRNHIYDLNYLLEYFKGSMLEPQSAVKSLNEYTNIKCLYCDKIFKTKLSWVYHNRTRSCGCISNNVSGLSYLVKKWFPEASLEFKIDGFKYDIKINDALIELHGLRYHSDIFRDSRKTDRLKYKCANDNGYKYLMFYEDEIKKSPDKVKNLISSKLGKRGDIKLRPQSLSFVEVSVKETKTFLNDYHYIGSCGASRHFAAYDKDRIVAVMLFSPPTRQNTVGIELSRFCVDPKYRIYGLGSWMLKRCIESGINLPIVSYSDNRLHDGGLYTNMGFTLDGNIKQDYYWVKNNTRYHKSSLRKPHGCEMTEDQLRRSQGYFKIFDLGKKRWVLRSST